MATELGPNLDDPEGQTFWRSYEPLFASWIAPQGPSGGWFKEIRIPHCGHSLRHIHTHTHTYTQYLLFDRVYVNPDE